ncbi:MAG TPA: hypothetical protein HA346_02045 [Thermoplasmata archaeon]|nr:hypothetical protein [Thermoplasmata archaeon]
MFKGFGKGEKAKKRYLSPEEIEKKIYEQKGKIPYFMLRELNGSLKEKEITKEKFDKIIENLTEQAEQTRIDKRIGNMGEELAKLSKGMDAVKGLIGAEKEIPQEFPLDKIGAVERRINEISRKIEERLSSNNELVARLTDRLNAIEAKTLDLPKERVESLNKGVADVSEGIGDLSRDMNNILGGVNIEEMIPEEE